MHGCGFVNFVKGEKVFRLFVDIQHHSDWAARYRRTQVKDINYYQHQEHCI